MLYYNETGVSVKNQNAIKIFAVILVACVCFSLFSLSAMASEKSSLGANRKELEQKLERVNKRLDELGSESKETEEYLSVLEEKIGYLRAGYNSAEKEIDAVESEAYALEKSIKRTNGEIKKTKKDISVLEEKIAKMNLAFDETYKAYCSRARAIYVSGSASTSIVTLLLSGDGLADLLTHLQMVSAVASSDLVLMQDFKEKTDEVVEKADELRAKNEELSNFQRELAQNKQSLKAQKTELVQKQAELKAQKNAIEEQQREANELLDEIHEKTKEYGEYRDITQEELDEIDKAIEEADKKYQQITTTAPQNETTQNSTTTTKAQSLGYIQLTYPCPAYKEITCGYGDYSGHTGCDFSTKGNENQKIVASESGTVIISTDLTNSNGRYRSYGRYIVIRHDKKTSKGETVYTLYAHNNSRLVSEGEYVTKGQQIAKSGSTGNSTGPHCHFEVRIGGVSQSYAVNPAKYLP